MLLTSIFRRRISRNLQPTWRGSNLSFQELSEFHTASFESFKSAVENFNKQIRVAKQLILECSSRNKVYLLLNCRKIVECLERTTKEISCALDLIPLAVLDVSSGINDEISNLCKDLLNAKYREAIAEEEILEKIVSGIQERNADQSYANNLLISIAKAVGISTERSELRKEFEDFKSEMKNTELRKDMPEALHQHNPYLKTMSLDKNFEDVMRLANSILEML